MKKRKVLAILLSMALVLGAVGCGSKEKPKEESHPKKEAVFTEKEIQDVIAGIEDHYVLQDAKGITQTVKHDATGHYDKVWVQDSAAWDEDIYENRTICNGCGKDITGNTDHIAWCDPGSYSIRPVKVGTKHHEAKGHYENKWVQDKAAWTETKTVGWKCSCGAKK